MFRGVQVPALGTSKDIVLRQFLSREARVSAKRAYLDVLLAQLTSSSEPTSRAKLNKVISSVYDEFVSLSFGIEPPEKNDEEELLKEFYDKVVKHTKPVLKKAKDGLVLETEGFTPFGTLN